MTLSIIRKSVAASALLCSSLLASGCPSEEQTTQESAPPETAQQAVTTGGTLVYGKPKDAVKLDPADITDGESAAVTENIFEGLVEFKPKSTEVEPALAESWQESDKGLTWVFKLRSGVKFHDGTPLDAAAVKFSYDRQRDPKSPYRFTAKFEYWSYFFKNVTSVEAPDAQTVVFKLSSPDATFLTNLALFNMGILSPEAIKKYGADIFKNPVGTGPFKFVSWSQNEKIVLASNPDYWKGKPSLDKLIFKPIPDNAVRLLELENGSIQGMDGINPDDVARIKQNSQLTLMDQPGMNVGYLALHNEKPPFNNVKVRQAIAHAINKPALVKAFFADGTLGTTAKNALPPTLWGYNDQVQDYPYDPAKAKKLLTEAGVPSGFSTNLWAMPVSRPYMPQPQRIAESIQADLKAVGIQSKIVSYEWGTYLDKLANGEHDMALIGWVGDNGDPDNFLYTLLSADNAKKGSASNYSFYKNQDVSKTLLQARSISDLPQRTALYQQAQAKIHNDAPQLPLFHATQLIAFRSNVKGFELHPTGGKFFAPIKMESQ